MRTTKNFKGFTLIEMLIYIAIFAIVAGLLVGILSTVTRVQNRETAAAEVTQQLEFVLQNIQRYVRESSNIDIPAGIATSTLKLRPNNSSTDPILIFADASNTAIYIQQRQGASTTLTSNRVTVGNFSVIKYENPGGHATVQLDMTLNYNTAISPLFTNVSRSLSTAIARVSAATFDSDLIPNTDNTFSVGQTLNRWKDAFFSKIAIGTTTITNLFQIATSTPILTVVNTGNVGIGTVSPEMTLDVRGNGININDGDNYGRLRSDTTGGLVLVSNQAGGTMKFYTGGVLTANERMTILANGNVGIWTTAPAGTFHVSNASSANALVVASNGNVGIGTTAPGSLLNIYSALSVGSIAEKIDFGPNVNRKMLLGVTTGATTYIQSTQSADEAQYRDFALNPSGGNVGIGNSAPTGLLHVSSSALYVSSTTGNVGIGTTGPGRRFAVEDAGTAQTSSPTGYRSVALFMQTTDTAGLLVGARASTAIFSPGSTGHDLAFYTSDAGTFTDRLHITSSGNVGIGTSTPSSLLSVSLAGAGSTGLGDIARFERTSAGEPDLLLESLGGAGNPFISFITDGNFGFVAGAANINTADARFDSKMVITSAGNVGIGTTTPASTLHVVGNYIQIPTVSAANPAAADCDAANEAGRMIIRTDGAAGTTLWVCKGASGWYGL